jgi:hypothetical protein
MTDHTHVEGNVFKMLLGSIETYWDTQLASADVSRRASREPAHNQAQSDALNYIFESENVGWLSTISTALY